MWINLFLYVFLSFRIVLGRILFILSFIPLSPFRPLKERRLFESDNFTALKSDVQNRYHGTFFISSEGEFEEVYEVMMSFLEHQKSIQIFYTSPSVTKKIQKFSQQSNELTPKSVWAMPLPVLTFCPFFLRNGMVNLWSLVRGESVFLCRYDFFPEILFLKFFKKKKNIRQMTLLSATLKNKTLQGLKRFYLSTIYQSFDQIVFATQKDLALYQNFLPKLPKQSLKVFNFRAKRIYNRISRGEHLEHFQKLLPENNQNRVVIIGSYWDSDREVIFQQESINLFVKHSLVILIFPHKLKDERTFKNLKSTLQGQNWNNLVYFENFTSMKTFCEKAVPSTPNHSFPSGIYYLDFSGYLVEGYKSCGLAYVGGGFERSIHSVLEPFTAQCEVLCGPKTYRSTEFDLMEEHGEKFYFHGRHVVDELGWGFSDALQDYTENFCVKSPSLSRGETSKEFKHWCEISHGEIRSMLNL